ncbi:hypothetical protein M8818_004550 [Zalaria obscura]|uniref:Uncharacterized protein n=1 Tax=Zalaria obscura TaxID=2024903 RepID=A0ACC3SC86_9PEZI
MAAEVVAGTPLAEALQGAVQTKLVDMGWSTGALDDSALLEYIIMMVVHKKTQEEVAQELSTDLLGLDPSDTSGADFARWLFETVNTLNAQLNGAPVAQTQQPEQAQSQQMDASAQEFVPAGGDMAMDDASGVPDAPSGPKAMRNAAVPKGPRNGRAMLGQVNKAMDRSGDASLHHIKGAAGAGRIGKNREPPKGPRNNNMANRMQNAMNGGRGMGMGGAQAMMANNPMMQGVSPQQQMQMLKLLEEQSRMMAQILGPNAAGQFGNAPAINPAFFKGQQSGGKSLFDRVEGKRQNGFQKRQPRQQSTTDGDTAMDGDTSTTTADGEKKESFDVLCKYNHNCTNASCPYAHAGPATTAGTTVDLSDTCSFGAACQNRKCSGKHPSPATRRQHLSTAVDCKFFPNCKFPPSPFLTLHTGINADTGFNPRCPFKHPSTPACRNGADCTVEGCTYSHSTVMCRYNPCLNPGCSFKHAEGQKRGKFEDKVWKAEGFDREGAEAKDRAHVSERFGSLAQEGEEELILPGKDGENGDAGGAEQENSMQADIVT